MTCLIWPLDRPNEIFFGLAEGKVRIGVLKTNKSNSMYASDSYCVSISASPDSNNICSGHLDGTIFICDINSKAKQKLCTHSSIPYALSWGVHILAGGNDGKLSFYETDGNCF